MYQELNKVLALPVLLIGLFASMMFAAPIVPGFTVETYANWSDPGAQPTELAFDHSSGVLYLGRDDVGAGSLKILRIPAGGTPVLGLPVANYEYGETAISDPDAAIVDASGTFSGTAGSVLVGCGYPGKIWSVSPVAPNPVTLWCDGPPITNPHKMALDNSGRLYISDETAQKIYRSDGGCPSDFATGHAFSGIDTNADDYVFTRAGGTVYVYDPDGNGDVFATGLANPNQSLLALGRGGIWGSDLYTVSDGHLLRYDAADINSPTFGDYVDDLGTGFDSVMDMTFGPDGALYVSVSEDTIYRITPEPATLSLFALGCWAMTRRKRR